MPVANMDRIDIHYVLRGDGPAVVLVSPFAAGGNVWDLVVPALEADHRCLVYDHRGVGASSTPRGPYTIGDLAGDLSSLCEDVGIDLSRALVVGQSMGGFVALELALRRRSRLGGLMLISTSPRGDATYMGMSDEAQHVMFRPVGKREAVLRRILEVSLGARVRREQPENIERFFDILTASPPTGAGYTALLGAVAAFDVRDRLSEITCPCTLIHGRDDAWVRLARAEALAKALPTASLVVLEDVGHFPQIEVPGEIAAEIRALTSRHQGA